MAELVSTTDVRKTVLIDLKLQRFKLPPVESALIIGKRALIGPKAMEKALNEMLPAGYELVEVDHPSIEALLINTSHLKRVPKDRLVDVLIRHAEQMMADDETLHVGMDIEIAVAERLEL